MRYPESRVRMVIHCEVIDLDDRPSTYAEAMGMIQPITLELDQDERPSQVWARLRGLVDGLCAERGAA